MKSPRIEPIKKVRINRRTNGIVIVAKSSFVSTACLFWIKTISDNNETIRIMIILAFFIFRSSSLSVETFYQLTPWHPLIKAASAKMAIAKTYV
jgi:hypothetical protein